MAELEVSARVQIHATAEFYDPLTPHGAWIEVGGHGRCWRPTHVPVGWRPYCAGHWVWTDCGWYWESDEPWAWACYHYGGWVHHPGHGWIWVPGVEWAPAWVYWRIGGKHVGWAPRPPGKVRVAPTSFVFVDTRRFGEPVRVSTVIVNDRAVLKGTRLITTVDHQRRTLNPGKPQQVVITGGPDVEMIRKAAGKPITPVSIREADRRTAVPTSLSPSAQNSESRRNPKTGERGRLAPGELRGRSNTGPVAGPTGRAGADSPKQIRSSRYGPHQSAGPAGRKAGGKGGRGKH